MDFGKSRFSGQEYMTWERAEFGGHEAISPSDPSSVGARRLD